MFKIDKNIPAPRARRGRRTYPWDKLEPGFSIHVPDRQPEQIKPTVFYQERKRGWTMLVDIDPAGGSRVWRLT